MILFLDTETTDLFRSDPTPYTDGKGRPYLVSIGYSSQNKYSQNVNELIVQCRDGVVSSPDALRTHGITQEMQEQGRPISNILACIEYLFENSKMVVAHNAEFDRNIIAAEFDRAGLKMPEIKWFCTRDDIGDITGEPAPEKQKQYRPDVPYRLLSLNALHQFLFDEPAQKEGEVHSAKDDAVSVARIFHELVYRRILDRNYVNESLM